MSILEKIRDRSANIAIVGLGYVGLPLAAGFAKTGFRVNGIDVDEARVNSINKGESYIPDVESDDVKMLVAKGRLKAATDFAAVASSEIVFICVPTPFSSMKSPDLTFIRSAATSVAMHLRPGQLVILQSTTHPGTTEEEVLPLLEKTGLKAGVDFHLAFCPERINPGDRTFTVENTPKVVGGLTPADTEIAAELLASMGASVFRVSSPRTAEMAKLLENIFRSVNIALVNELAKLSERMDIDIWEVIGAASTKPFGFLPFYPGAGVGGHCIPVDPYYLSWKAREYDFFTRFIELAAEVNESMPYHAVDKVSHALESKGKLLSGADILVLGVAFKKDIDDARNSVTERVIELLLSRGANVTYNDPYVPTFTVGGNVFFKEKRTLTSVELTDEVLAKTECLMIVTGHSNYDYQRLVDNAAVVVDTCNATKGVDLKGRQVFKIGVSSHGFGLDG